MKIKHIVSCFFVSLIGLSACSIEELPYNQLTEDELDGSYESLLSATRGNYAVFKQTAFHQGWHYAGELASDNVSLSGVSSDALMYIYNYQRIRTTTICRTCGDGPTAPSSTPTKYLRKHRKERAKRWTS